MARAGFRSRGSASPYRRWASVTRSGALNTPIRRYAQTPIRIRYASPFSFRISAAFDLSTRLVPRVIFLSIFSPFISFNP
jgi:hypothetical protein